MNKNEVSLFFQKITWALAPVIWGIFSWSMGWGVGAQLIPSVYGINFIVRMALPILVVSYLCGSTLQYASKEYVPTFFDTPFWVPSWIYFVLAAAIAAVIAATPLSTLHLIGSLTGGVLISAVVEELVTRSFFIKYRMRIWEFIFFNILSSAAFTYMHTFYEKDGVALTELFLQRGHLMFSFILGVIAYKTQRIEIAMLLHMLSNLLRYTIPVCLFQCQWPEPQYVIGSLFVELITILALSGCAFRKKRLENKL